jgi:hypothetical protein
MTLERKVLSLVLLQDKALQPSVDCQDQSLFQLKAFMLGLNRLLRRKRTESRDVFLRWAFSCLKIKNHHMKDMLGLRNTEMFLQRFFIMFHNGGKCVSISSEEHKKLIQTTGMIVFDAAMIYESEEKSVSIEWPWQTKDKPESDASLNEILIEFRQICEESGKSIGSVGTGNSFD